MNRSSNVYVRKVETDIGGAMHQLLQSLIDDIKISNGDKVCIKPNICILKKANTGITTDPRVVQSVIEFIQNKWECEISIVESDATINSIDIAYDALGWKEMASKVGVELVNLSKDKRIATEFKGYVLSNPKIPKTLHECDYLISVPKLKAHEITGITGVLKNQFGCLPKRRKAVYHRKISETIVDAATLFKPQLSIIDAIITTRGGVITGTPIRTNLILASTDPVAMDAVCAKYVGINPKKIKHIQLAEKIGLGTQNFVLHGNIDELRPLNLSSKTLVDRFTTLFMKMTSRGA